ncbi:putative transposase [Burkholderia pseudomallei MSHR640]|nr:putative transposase [Burkholderia pseudomallei MSHR640]
MVRRAFSEEFKEEAIRLVVEQGYPVFQSVWGGWNWGDSPASLGHAVAGGA